LIGLILEKVDGRPHAELLQHYITGPLGMTDTRLTVPDEDTGRIAVGYMKSTTADMVKYMQFCLDEKNAVARLSQRVTFNNTGEHDADIALYWFVKQQPGGYRELLHGGGSFGTTSLCLLVPQHRIGVICIANDAAPETEHTLTLLSEAIAKTLISSTQTAAH
jgi:CubicO group peptidase (beta-lactamase class C family)